MPDAVPCSAFPGCALPEEGSFSACWQREEEELGCVVLPSTLDGLGAGMQLAAGL